MSSVNESTFGNLHSRIVALNMAKDMFAIKKCKGQSTSEDEKMLMDDLISVLSIIRSSAFRMGISTTGEYQEETEDIKMFKNFNSSVRDIKEQCVFLTKHNREEIMKEMESKMGEEKSDRPKLSRKEAIVEKLRGKLADKADN